MDRCPQHPRYKGVGKPRPDCPGCFCVQTDLWMRQFYGMWWWFVANGYPFRNPFQDVPDERLRCRRHPRYRGGRKSKQACMVCDEIYRRVHNEPWEGPYVRQLREMRTANTEYTDGRDQQAD